MVSDKCSSPRMGKGTPTSRGSRYLQGGMSLFLAPRTMSSTNGWSLLFSYSATAADTCSWMRRGSSPVDNLSISNRCSVTQLSSSFSPSLAIVKTDNLLINNTISRLICGIAFSQLNCFAVLLTNAHVYARLRTLILNNAALAAPTHVYLLTPLNSAS